MKIGIIGYGYWGPNITRNFMNLEGATVKMVVDQRTERLELVQKAYPAIQVSTQIEDIWQDQEIDAVAIVTPIHTHYEFAKQALLHGKHVLVEKPLTTKRKEVEELIELAEQKGLVLMVDHTFLYTGSVEKIKELMDSGEIGDVKYVDSTRINLGLFQNDVNVLWDLAAHDLSIMGYLFKEKPSSLQAIGVSHTSNKIENIAYLILHYDSGMIAHFNCSWSSPVKIRQMLIGGDKQMILYDDIQPTDKLRVYDKGYSVVELDTDEDRKNVLIDYRLGDCVIPKVHIREALAGMVKDFKNAIHQGTTPRSSYQSGLEVVTLLELAEESLRQGGKLMKTGL